MSGQTEPIRHSQRIKKPVTRYSPEPTKFVDDDWSTSSTEDSSSEDDVPTEADLSFIDNRPTAEIGADTELTDEEDEEEEGEISEEDEEEEEDESDAEEDMDEGTEQKDKTE